MRNFHHKHEHKPFPENLIYGVHPVLEALYAGKEIEKILLQRESGSPQVKEILQMAAKAEVPVQKVPAEKLNRLIRGNHQGVAAFVSLIAYQPLEPLLMDAFEKGEVPVILILDRITDVRNIGAIARTAECAGVAALVVPAQGGGQLNADAIKTSAGALNTLPVHRSSNLKITINYLKQSGFRIVAVTEHGKQPYFNADFLVPTALILGSEEDGISPEYLKLTDETIKIPMKGKTASLNVSVATGIILFELLRQQSL